MQHLYGASKKDHINYSYISTIDDALNKGNKPQESSDVNQLQAEQRSVVLPSFKELISFIHDMSNKRLSNSSVQRHTYGKATLVYSYDVCTEVETKKMNRDIFKCK